MQENYTVHPEKTNAQTSCKRAFFLFFPPWNGRKNAQIIWFFTGPDVRVELQEHGLSLGDSKSKPVI